jgi:hypothetical protein
MGGGVQFGVSTDWQTKAEWMVNGMTFRKVGYREITLLGKSIGAFLIRSEIPDVELWYLMSPREGLIAFGSKHAKGTYLQYWSEAKCGFAADKKCN